MSKRVARLALVVLATVSVVARLGRLPSLNPFATADEDRSPLALLTTI